MTPNTGAPGDRTHIGVCGRVRRPNRRQIGLICTQPSGEITNGAAEQIGGYFATQDRRTAQSVIGAVRDG